VAVPGASSTIRRLRRSAALLPRGERLTALAFVLPTLLYLLALSVYPLFYAGWQSLNLSNLFNPTVTHFIGLRNYTDLFEEDFFWISVKTTLVWTIVVVSIELVLGLALALLLDRKLRGVGLLRSLIIIPVFISPIGMGLTWRFIYEPVGGLGNWLLGSVGLGESRWISSTETALPSIMIADIWQWTPFVALILLAGIQSISPEILEAARLDRVRGPIYVFRIVLPLIWPVLLVVALIRLVDSIRTFDLVYIMTRGGPGSSTLVASVYDFTIFQAGNLGKMAALGFLLLLLINALVVVFLRALSRQERRTRRAARV